MSDDNDIKFRDDCAMRILSVLLENTISKNNSFVTYIMDEMTLGIADETYFQGKINKLARASYKLADAMRKARLASFK